MTQVDTSPRPSAPTEPGPEAGCEAAPAARGSARLLPGLGVVAATTAVALLAADAVPVVSPLMWATAICVAIAPLVRRAPATSAGVRFAGTRLLRVGVALLGLRIAADDLVSLGVSGLALVVGAVALTMTSTVALGRLLGVGRRLTLLIATGTSICGAAAIAAVDSVVRADEEEVAYAVAAITVLGSLAMVVVPVVGLHVLDLGPRRTAMWAGASIHEVAQVAGAGAAISTVALQVAMIVKLGRVVLLAPLVTLLCLARDVDRPSRGAGIPPFVVAFLLLVAARSLLPVPAAAIDAATAISTALLTAALGALGLQIRWSALRAAGIRPLFLGLAAWGAAAVGTLAILLAAT